MLECLNNSLLILYIKLVLYITNPLCKQNPPLSNSKASCNILVIELVSIINSGLCDKGFERLVEANIKRLNKTSTSFKNIRCRTT
jgi:hypothetical protein